MAEMHFVFHVNTKISVFNRSMHLGFSGERDYDSDNRSGLFFARRCCLPGSALGTDLNVLDLKMTNLSTSVTSPYWFFKACVISMVALCHWPVQPMALVTLWLLFRLWQ